MKTPPQPLQLERSRQPLASGWKTWWSDKGPVLLFGVKFGALLLLLYILLALPFADAAIYSYLEVNAWLANVILNLVGQGTEVSDVTIRSPEFAIAIRRGCDAIEPAWLLCAAMVAFPSTWRRRWVGMMAGVSILQALNVVRIVTLFWIGSRFPVIFPSAHLEIWPAAFVLVSIMLFVGWKGWRHET